MVPQGLLPTIVLVTITGRVLGEELLAHYLAKPQHIIIAAVQNQASSDTRDLRSLSRGSGSELIITKIDSGSPTGAAEVVEWLQREHNISRIDTVVVNAGIRNSTPGEKIDVGEMNQVIQANTKSIIQLYQATLPLLQRSKQQRFVFVSSSHSSISAGSPSLAWAGSYGLPTTAASYLMEQIGSENEDLVAFVIDPGLVEKDTGYQEPHFAEEEPVAVEDSAKRIITEVSTCTHETPGYTQTLNP
ncbi:hypothetical protein F5Y18DRAFT_423393 [Xylariaceae sp. FL1019]|nr:hypothetical protein F5Y18DRAFT_423393 [Xylariaceae sp. FL1019]